MNNLNKSSRIWIYQSDRIFDEKTEHEITDILNQFNKNWNAHHQKLHSDYLIKYHAFIILIVDESAVSASGCSIDSSVKIIKEIESKFDLNFFNRNIVAYKKDNEIVLDTFETFQSKIDAGIINSDTIVFNNLINKLEDLETNWEVPISKSWHKRFFNFPTNKLA